MRKSEQETDTAYHEAGHTVVARKLHRKVKYVTIVPGPGYLGEYLMEPVSVTDATLISVAETVVIIYLAGPTAECRYRRPKSVQELVQWMVFGRADGEAARDAVSRAADHIVFPEPLGAECPDVIIDRLCDEFDQRCVELFEELCVKTDRLVAEHWSAIERVADGLLDFSTLNGTDVDDLIAGRFLRTRTARLPRCRNAKRTSAGTCIDL
jgi:hypothetical protein